MLFLVRSIALLTLLTFITSCRSTQIPKSAATTEISSQKETLDRASRIVSISSLPTDIISQLDQSKLVGVGGTALVNQNPALKDLPRVSEGRTPPNLEKIVALKPDLVIGSEGMHDQTLNQLKSMGIKTLATGTTDWISLRTLTQTLAAVTNTNPDPLLKRYESFIKKPKNSPSVMVLAGYQPILSPNKTSWTGDLLQQFGLKNLTADLQGESRQRGFITLSPEKILEVNPDRLILVDTGDGTIDQYKASPFWSQLKAVQTNQILTFDYYGLVNPGSIQSIEKACQKISAEI